MRLAASVKNHADAPTARRGCGIAAIPIKSVVVQEKFLIATKEGQDYVSQGVQLLPLMAPSRPRR